MRILTFVLTPDTKITINAAEPITMIGCCYDDEVIFENNNKKIDLGSQTVRDDIATLNGPLRKALNNALHLDETITDILGYLFNQYTYQLSTDDVEEYVFFKEVDNFWVGDRHQIWTSLYSTWLYNNESGAIVFEIAPVFPGFFTGKDLDVDAYHEWMKSFKLYYQTIIPRAIAQKWLEQTDELLKIIDDNTRRFTEEYERSNNNNHDF